ncbi:hypothetical protein [Streptomyces sp. TRM68367]|uniref:hypothetical protein n=1 Tax=Streptomyces sp. TRM68367 TaxID=2758415 RepID=UPI0021D312B4|nr:hypothetical protein [Streptomyces sp. TRM68367]
MSGNRAVAYLKPGAVEVRIIDHPTLGLQGGPGVAPDNVGRECRVILKARGARPASV